MAGRLQMELLGVGGDDGWIGGTQAYVMSRRGACHCGSPSNSTNHLAPNS